MIAKHRARCNVERRGGDPAGALERRRISGEWLGTRACAMIRSNSKGNRGDDGSYRNADRAACSGPVTVDGPDPARESAGMTDEALMLALAKGRADVLSALYDRFGRLAYALAYRMLSDEAAAEDVVQEAFVSAWRNAPSFDSARGSARAWLLTMVRNRCIDVLRGPRRPSKLDDLAEVVPAADDVLAEVLHAIQAQDVQVALGRLPEEQRTTINLAYFGGMTHAQIASHMRVPLGTVKGRMRLALEKLRELLIATSGLEPAPEG